MLTLGLIEQQPELDVMLDLDTALRLREREDRVIGLAAHYQVGDLFVIYGDQVGGGSNPAKKVVDTWCRSVAMGHVHTPAQYTKSSLAHENERWTGTVIPCLSETNPGYGRGRAYADVRFPPDSLSHGFIPLCALAQNRKPAASSVSCTAPASASKATQAVPQPFKAVGLQNQDDFLSIYSGDSPRCG